MVARRAIISIRQLADNDENGFKIKSFKIDSKFKILAIPRGNDKRMIILGIDPGTTIVGYGIIKKTKNNIHCLDYGIIKSPMKENREKFFNIYKELKNIINRYKPNMTAVEKLFFFKNAKTVISVSEARGAILLTTALLNIPFREYTPLQVKQAVTGYGKADKNQVQKMVRTILNLSEIPKPDDAADALAIAICCLNTSDIKIY